MDKLPGWAAAVIAVFCVLFGLAVMFVFLLIGRERNGKPMFGTQTITVQSAVSSTAQSLDKSSV